MRPEKMAWIVEALEALYKLAEKAPGCADIKCYVCKRNKIILAEGRVAIDKLDRNWMES